MRRTFAKHKALEAICSNAQALLPHKWSSFSLTAIVFLEFSGYSAQTATKNYISEESLTAYYAT